MEETKKQYLELLSEIIAKEAVILGPDIAILKARGVPGLILDDKGRAVDIKGYEADTAQKLINEYLQLSGQGSKNIIDLIFEKYPQIKKII